MAGRKKVEQTSILDEDEEGLEPGDESPEAERLKRNQSLDIKGLPEGVKALLRLKPWRDAKEYSAYIYRREPDPTRPGRIAKKFQRRVYNTEIEESWLQANFPRGGRFSVIYQMPHPSRPGDVQIHTDDFEIDPVQAPDALAAPSVGAPVPAAQAAGADSFTIQLANLRGLVECVQVLQGNQPAAASPPAWYEKMYAEKLKRLDELEEKLMRKTQAPALVTATEIPDEAAGWPEFLRPFVPAIKQYGIKTLEALGNKLMGGGLEGAGLRFLVLNSPTFQAIWNDPTRREQAAAALISALGDVGESLVRMLAEEMAKRGQP